MNLDKIKYSKCPNCRQNGISAFMKLSKHHNPVLICKHCKKKYKVNFGLSLIVYLTVSIIFGFLAHFINTYIIHIPLWLWGILIAISLLFFEYFAPLEDIENE